MKPGQREVVIARAMDTFPEAVPYLAALCEDFDGLGTIVRDALAMLDEAGDPPGAALDLGCGKGAHTEALAMRGWRVTAVDLHPPFLDEARRRAKGQDVTDRCEFLETDLVGYADNAEAASADLVLLMAIGRPWGTLEATIGALRRLVRPGGLLLIDDAFLEGEEGEPSGYEGYAPLDATERALTGHGETIVSRRIPGNDEARAQHERELRWLRQRGEALIADNPSAAEVVRRFLSMQEGAYEDLVGPVRGATWLLRRGADA